MICQIRQTFCPPNFPLYSSYIGCQFTQPIIIWAKMVQIHSFVRNLAQMKLRTQWPSLQKRVLYMHSILWLWRGITSFISELSGQTFQSYKSNDRMVLLPNFKAVGQTQTELHSLKVEKLDACIRPIFANLVTIIAIATC